MSVQISKLQHLIPQHLLSRVIGCVAASKIPWVKNTFINRYRKHYAIDMSESLYTQTNDFKCFNDFFTRALKPGARPIVDAEDAIVCPVDGTMYQLGKIDANTILNAKDHRYDIASLLGGNKDFAQLFHNGNYAIMYLAPTNYHRVHMPLMGELKEMIHIPGKLFSVNNASATAIDNLFARNERLACLFDTNIGPMAVILVGAMIVASIETIWAGTMSPTRRKHIRTWRYPSLNHNPIELNKGDEMGLFKLGSTAIVLFPPNKMRWKAGLEPGSELRVGEQVGTII